MKFLRINAHFSIKLSAIISLHIKEHDPSNVDVVLEYEIGEKAYCRIFSFRSFDDADRFMIELVTEINGEELSRTGR